MNGSRRVGGDVIRVCLDLAALLIIVDRDTGMVMSSDDCVWVSVLGLRRHVVFCMSCCV